MTRSRRGSTGVGRRSPLPSGDYVGRRAVRGGAEGLTVLFCGDDGRRGEFDFSTLALPGWRVPLAEAFGVRVGAAGGLRTLASARNCWAVLVRLTRFLATLDEPPVTPARLTVADMEAFYCHRSTSMRPEYARKEVADVGVFMSSTALAGVVDPDVMDHLRRRNLTRTIPGVGGYSDGEFTRLVAAARTDVAAIRDRIQAGEDLLARYQADPTALSAEDASVGAELAAMAATGLVPPQEGLFERGLSGRLDVAGRLFLTSRDLAPLMVLLAAVTGRNGETIKELPVEHKVLEGRAIELEVVKRRQGQSRWFDTVAWEIGAPERALHTPGGLYLLLLTLSRRSRGFCGGGHAICMWRNGYRSRLPLGPAEHFAPFAEKLHGCVAMVPWVASRQVNGEAHPVLADPTPGTDVGVPLRVSFNRIKTSVEVRRTRQMGGHLPSAARTNTMQVLFRSYLSGDATTIDWASEVVGEAVAEAERSALDAHQRALAAAGGTLRVLPGPRGTATAATGRTQRCHGEAGRGRGTGHGMDGLRRPRPSSRYRRRVRPVVPGVLSLWQLPGHRQPSLRATRPSRCHGRASQGDERGPVVGALRSGVGRHSRRRPGKVQPCRAGSGGGRQAGRRRAGPGRGTMGASVTPTPTPTPVGARSVAADGGLDDVFVLHGRPLAPGYVLENTSRFGDDIWHLTPALQKRHQRAVHLRFPSVPIGYRRLAKELFYAMLSGPLPYEEQRRDLLGIRNQFSEAVRFLTWLDDRETANTRRRPLSALTGEDLEAYQHHLLTVLPSSPQTRVIARGFVRHFWRYRKTLGDAGLRFDPQHLDAWGEPDAAGRRENTTDRIPQVVQGALLVWALRFVDDFAVDIVAGDREWRTRNRGGVHTNIDSGNPYKPHIRARLEVLLADHLARNVPLPGHNGRLSVMGMANLLGCHGASVTYWRPLIDPVATVVGVTAHTTLAAPITATFDGEAWVEAMATHHSHEHSVAVLARMLHVACYMVIAFLSGMRDSEIKHLRRGCLTVERDPEGVAYRWKITGLAFKGEADPAGVAATWIVGEPAGRAVAVIEALQPPATDLLFARLDHSCGAKATHTTGAMTTSTTNNHMNDFVAWVGAYCAARGSAERIPDVNDRVWHLHTRQFRRTLAWFIARRPGGSIAGALQYRHHSIQMFEGYAGTSESGFRAEVESEQALARGEQLMEMVDNHQHLDLAGPAADEAARRLEVLAEQGRFQGTVIVDPVRLRRLMRQGDPAIYPGKYVTCVHDHTKALCERARHGGSEGLPDHGGCQPLACRNVALTTANVAALREEAGVVDRRLAAPPPLPPLLIQRLAGRRAEIEVFLGRHTTGSGSS